MQAAVQGALPGLLLMTASSAASGQLGIHGTNLGKEQDRHGQGVEANLHHMHRKSMKLTQQ
jgi:hypothetical protein